MANTIQVGVSGYASINGDTIQLASGTLTYTPDSDSYIDTVQTLAVEGTTAAVVAKGALSTIHLASIKNNADPIANPTYSVVILNQATVSGAVVLATIAPGQAQAIFLQDVANIYANAVAGTPQIQYKLFQGKP